MVDYMTPVYWFFVMLSMGALIILRRRHPDAPRPVKTPFFPLFPAVFGLISLYMLGAGLLELGLGALYGAGVMAVGAGLMLLVRIGQGRAKAPEGEGRA
jgi:amino acid transporter